MTSRLLSAYALPGLPEIQPGDDLVRHISLALGGAGIELRDGDVLVVASKIVSKAEGRFVYPRDRAAHEQLVKDHSRRLVAERRVPGGTVQVVASAAGPVMAAAGIDRSNVGSTGAALLLPADSDASARALREGVASRIGASVGVIITDTVSRPWRLGVGDIALGASGVTVLEDLRSRVDRDGRELTVTQRAVADEIAAAADLVKDKSRGLPVAIVRGLDHLITGGELPARALNRTEDDWFARGSVESVRDALGLPQGAVAPPPIDGGDDLPSRVSRALDVATASPGLPGTNAWAVRVGASGALLRIVASGERAPAADGGHPDMVATLALGALIQRLRLALAIEELDAEPVCSWRPDGRLESAELRVVTR